MRKSLEFLKKQSQDSTTLYLYTDIIKSVDILEAETKIRTKDKGGTLGIFVVKEDLNNWEEWTKNNCDN